MEITNADLLRYYLAWEDYEKEILEKIKNDDEDAFHQYLIEMKITRNFKQNSYKKVYKVSKDYQETNHKSTDANNLSEELFNHNLVCNGKKNVIVAASKILWAFNKKAIIIYTQAKRTLAKLAEEKIYKLDSYNFFCKTWEDKYKEFKPLYKEKTATSGIAKLDVVFEEEWFIRRTFDNYLWAHGKKSDKTNNLTK